jgi:hypothetical protein
MLITKKFRRRGWAPSGEKTVQRARCPCVPSPKPPWSEPSPRSTRTSKSPASSSHWASSGFGSAGGHAHNDRCGAWARSAQRACIMKAVRPGGRCPLHGGASTGPTTKEGHERSRAGWQAYWERWRAEHGRPRGSVRQRTAEARRLRQLVGTHEPEQLQGHKNYEREHDVCRENSDERQDFCAPARKVTRCDSGNSNHGE